MTKLMQLLVSIVLSQVLQVKSFQSPVEDILHNFNFAAPILSSFHPGEILNSIQNHHSMASGGGDGADGSPSDMALTVGGIGTFVLGVAGKGIASQLVSGISLKATKRLSVGDIIAFDDNVRSTVQRIDLLSVELRTPDERIIKIPNSQLMDKQVSNLSRQQKSSVKETLYINYEDKGKIPRLVKEIQREIENACTELVTDGSRPFQIYLSKLAHGHIEIEVEAHFEIPPIGDRYVQNKQKVLLAICDAVNSSDVSFFVLPALKKEKERQLR